MQLTISKADDYTLVKINDARLDAVCAPQLRQRMSELISGGTNRLIIDLSTVQFMDSSSLGTLVGILKMIGSKGDLIIAGSRGIVTDLFRLTRMDRVFRMAPDVETAMQQMIMA